MTWASSQTILLRDLLWRSVDSLVALALLAAASLSLLEPATTRFFRSSLPGEMGYAAQTESVDRWVAQARRALVGAALGAGGAALWQGAWLPTAAALSAAVADGIHGAQALAGPHSAGLEVGRWRIRRMARLRNGGNAVDFTEYEGEMRSNSLSGGWRFTRSWIWGIVFGRAPPVKVVALARTLRSRGGAAAPRHMLVFVGMQQEGDAQKRPLLVLLDRWGVSDALRSLGRPVLSAWSADIWQASLEGRELVWEDELDEGELALVDAEEDGHVAQALVVPSVEDEWELPEPGGQGHGGSWDDDDWSTKQDGWSSDIQWSLMEPEGETAEQREDREEAAAEAAL